MPTTATTPTHSTTTPSTPIETTRVIIKNLARACTGDDLRKSVASLGVSVTDASIAVNKAGESRRFGFIGFKSVDDARQAVAKLNNTYVGTSKVVAEFAMPVGAENIPKSMYKRPTSGPSAKPGANAGVKAASTITKEQEESLQDHGRVHVVNLPHGASKEEIEEFFSQFGTVRETHVVMDESLGRPKGIAFVTFVFPKDAVKCVTAGEMISFQGRLLRIRPAVEKERRPDQEGSGKDGRMTDFQAKRLEKKRAEASTAVHTWNLLYTSANAAASAIVDQLDGEIDRADLLLGNSTKDDVAVKAAIAETEIVSQTRQWLQQQGIAASAFERSGASLLTASAPTTVKRSTDTIVIKHLPVDVDMDSLRHVFSRNGEMMVKFLLAPSKTVAIVQFADAGAAKRSFTANAFRRYNSVPMYLEWAPENIFNPERDQPNPEESTANAAAEDDSSANLVEEEEQSEGNGDVAVVSTKSVPVTLSADIQTSRLCVRNVAFEATAKDLRKLFSAYGRVVAVRLPTKMSAAGDASTGIRKQHRGFAFVEFTSRAELVKAFEALQSTHLYGRKLVLEPAAMEDGSVDAAREKAQRRQDLAEGTLASESKRRKLDAATEGGDDDGGFDDLLM